MYDRAFSMGDAFGCGFAGLMYEQGKATQKSISKALDYYTKGCDVGWITIKPVLEPDIIIITALFPKWIIKKPEFIMKNLVTIMPINAVIIWEFYIIWGQALKKICPKP